MASIAARLRSVAPRLACTVAVVLSSVVIAHAGEPAAPSADAVAFFETKIRPVLVERCYQCHSADAEELKGGLAVDSRAGLLAGGDSGPALVAGDPAESLLIAALKYEAYEMPPDGQLPPEVIADFEKWIAAGAADPRDGAPPAVQAGMDVEAGRKFWSFQPLALHAPPVVQNASWPLTEVDRFILAKLEAHSLAPAADAERTAWLRRVTFDLVGLPPTRAEQDAFAADGTPDAHARVVDHLLASPHFGERWGRHWLDVARFAESSGGGRSIVFKDAWRYRDYVIAAFNRDKPIDQFIVEQLAGDLLPAGTLAQQRERLIATAYLMLGAHNYEEQDKRALEMDVVDEQLDAIGRGLLGMTIACARCHDHKFDPIPTHDYYALAGILRSTHTIVHENVSKWTTRPLPMTAAETAAVAAYQAALVEAERVVEEAKSRATDDKHQKLVKSLSQELTALKKRGPPAPVAMAAADADAIADCQICIRGSVRHRGPAVPRGVLQVATLSEPPAMPADASGRLELARWIASPENPLTARVYANRVWSRLFGAGLVRTADNFGTTGEPPSHSELLDYLAQRFIDDGWSAKRLIRELVLSRTYRMSAAAGAESAAAAAAVDPENRLLWRMNRRRLDAEALRDAMLAVSGRLDLKVGGPNIDDGAVLRKSDSTTPTEYDYVFADSRRSVYTPAFRNRMHELFEVFDFANQNSAVAVRSVTTVAPQALLMLNSSFVMDQARAAAERALADDALTDQQRVEHAFRDVLGRPPSDDERQVAQAAIAAAPAEDAAARADAWQQLYQALFGSVDFRYLD